MFILAFIFFKNNKTILKKKEKTYFCNFQKQKRPALHFDQEFLPSAFRQKNFANLCDISVHLREITPIPSALFYKKNLNFKPLF